MAVGDRHGSWSRELRDLEPLIESRENVPKMAGGSKLSKVASSDTLHSTRSLLLSFATNWKPSIHTSEPVENVFIPTIMIYKAVWNNNNYDIDRLQMFMCFEILIQ